MNCKRIEELILTDHADGMLKGEALKELEAHIASCDACRRLADSAAATERLFRAAGREEAPESVWLGVKAAITADAGVVQPSFSERVLEPLRDFFARMRPAVVAVTAAVLIFAAIAVSRMAFNAGGLPAASDEDEIYAMISVEEDWNGQDNGLGTAAEQYFL